MALTIRTPKAEKKLADMAKKSGIPTSAGQLAKAAIERVAEMSLIEYREFIASRPTARPTKSA